MRNGCQRNQAGMTLIEVLVAVLINAIGLLGAAAIQLNALKYTDSSAMTSQASFIAYDMMDRIRANVDGNAASNFPNDVLASYALGSLSAAPTAGDQNNARNQDLFDFRTNVTAFAGTDGAASKIVIAKPVVTITIEWSDSRAVNSSAVAVGDATNPTTKRTFVLSSRIGADAVAP